MNRHFIPLAAICLVTSWIFWPRPAFAHSSVVTTVQFDREIVHILNNHCVMCHVENGPAFPLVTYEQTYAKRYEMRMDALNRHMAPWAAVAGYGDFANANDLARSEIDFIASWAEGFGPRNNGAVATGIAIMTAKPKAIQAHFDSSRWKLGTPDLVLPLPENTIERQPAGEIKRTVIDPKLASERWVRGLEFQPGDRRVVHAVFFTIQETGQWIGSWTPWYGFVSLPKGLAYRLPAGSHIVAEIHYYGSNERVVEHGSLGLYFADQPSVRMISDLVFHQEGDVREDAAAHRYRAVMNLAEDVNVLALRPDVQSGARSVEVAAKTPGGVTQVLLVARDFSTAWPTPYILKRSVALPKGTSLSVTEYYAKGGAPQVAGAPLVISGYGGAQLPRDEPKTLESKAPPTPVRRFPLAGVVKSVDAASRRLTVQHGDIPGLMGAMTMAYGTGKQEDLKKISPGDQIQAEVVVSDTATYLENIKVAGHLK